MSPAQQVDTSLLKPLHWRAIGPLRGGRTKAACGVPGQPGVFYMAQVNGGIWKTNDFGRTWQPIFDDQPTGSIGALAVAPSDPNVVYAGSGEGLHRPDLSVGDGIYKSTDAGKTWTHLGLRDGQQIPQIAVDPKDPDHILVAVAGHPYGPNEERGIFLSLDGGKTFTKSLYKDENTGASDVVFDPQDASVAYAALWESREGPWENAAWDGGNGGIYKSTDGGAHWQQLTGGLPQAIIQANLGISRSNPQRLVATVATKGKVEIYRTDDGGANWAVITTDTRPAGRIGGGDLSVPRIDPKNPDVVYITSTVTWKSTDGGKTWIGFRGAPGGDDYQNMWINPDDPRIILLVSDQGAIVTVNGGESWSSWYNQPTAQMYHVSTDNAFPYRVCGGQQESGSACVSSRGNDGAITMREWHPVAAEEYGYVQPDPLDPDMVYGGKLTRWDRRTAQAQDLMPKAFRGKDFRVIRTEPIVFAPKDPHTMFFATNTLWSTKDGGLTWKQVSPDLTRKTYTLPKSIGKYSSDPSAQPTQRGVIYAVAPSPVDSNVIWAGTDDGLIQLTTDAGAHWSDVTPPALGPFWKVSIIEASHTDSKTAYAAVNTLRLDDLRPHIFRTHDLGKTWSEIVNGLPQDENVDTVREDTVRKGLLFAGTEAAVYVSFDDGDHWQPLRLNMAASSVRDLAIKDDDLIAATHGRGFWILDDITPLRQLQASVLSAPAHLFAPQTATRVRWDMNTDTPLPPDEPQMENPPDGAVIDYYLGSAARGPVTLEVRDAAGKVVRKFSSADPVPPPDPKLAIPAYWVRPPQTLSAEAGMHRFLWDMHLAPLADVQAEYPIAAVPHNTAPAATSPWVLPGRYTVVLTAGGKSYSQPLLIKMDPRVKASPADLKAQFDSSNQLYALAQQVMPVLQQTGSLTVQVKALGNDQKAKAVSAPLQEFAKKLAAVAGGPRAFGAFTPPPIFGAGSAEANIGQAAGRIGGIFAQLESYDGAPTEAQRAGIAELERTTPPLLAQWKQLLAHDLPQINQQLEQAHLPELDPARKEDAAPSEDVE